MNNVPVLMEFLVRRTNFVLLLLAGNSEEIASSNRHGK